MVWPFPSVDRFFVVYNRSAAWAKPLRLGDNRTDNDQINGLIDKFNLKITKHVEWDEENNSFHVKAEEYLNIAPIGQSISKVEGVKMVDLLMPDGDGNDIEIAQIEGGYELIVEGSTTTITDTGIQAPPGLVSGYLFVTLFVGLVGVVLFRRSRK